MALRPLTLDELNKAALEQFVYQPVSRDMVAFLAEAAHRVITCDPTLSAPPPASSSPSSSPSSSAARGLPPTPPRSPKARPADDSLPTLQEFITQLVVSSNVQVPTLMSALVYLGRLKSKLQPMARGLRCTTHRIFLASLILAAKYLNDSSPKNKHWANYTHVHGDAYTFGFNRTEVNLMEKQLLFLLEWELRITEQDLYRELDAFLAPLRSAIAERHARKMRQREEKRRQQELYAAATRYPLSPPSSRATSRSRHASPELARAPSGGSLTPPELTYSSSASSYASPAASSRQPSRATTPLEPDAEPYAAGLYDTPVDIVVDADVAKMASAHGLPYELSAEQYHELHDASAVRKRHKRGMWGRLLGGAVPVR